ncbi:MAG: hypothetical protein M1827_005979 [Pycnora praestabilis]|nr:MAG: hypothetical protein M1827_005979 [Pycnora praestabilis]
MAKVLERARSFRSRDRKPDAVAAPKPFSKDVKAKDDLHILKTDPITISHFTATRMISPDGIRVDQDGSQKAERSPKKKRKDNSPVEALSSGEVKDKMQKLRVPASSPIPRSAPKEEVVIGMALGSPSQNPSYDLKLSLPFRTDSMNNSRSTVSSSIPPQEFHGLGDDEDHISKNKSSKWKTWGGIFAKKASGSPSSFYQLQQTSPDIAFLGSDTLRVTEGKTETVELRKIDSIQRKRNPVQSPLKRSDKTPIPAAETAPRPPPKDAGLDLRPARPRPAGSRMLNVDIPNIEMERYSVMFGNLLGPKPTPQPPLLTRRKATLENVKTSVTDKVHLPFFTIIKNNQLTDFQDEFIFLDPDDGLLKPTRRVTSPPLSKSPIFSLFPSASPGSVRDVRSPSPGTEPHHIQRSLTTPNTISSDGTTCEATKPRESQIVLLVHSPARESVSFSDTSILSPASSQQTFDTDDVTLLPQPLRPKLNKEKPVREMILKPPEKELLYTPGPMPISAYKPACNMNSKKMKESDVRAVAPKTQISPASQKKSLPKPPSLPDYAFLKTDSSAYTKSASGANSNAATSSSAGAEKALKPKRPSPKTSKSMPLPPTLPKATVNEFHRRVIGSSENLVSTNEDSNILLRNASPQRSPKKLRSPGDAKDEAEALINSAAEVSIARQISVSQRQRLLLPIIPKSERMVDRRPLQAKLVELRYGDSRKSHYGQVESE